MSDGAVENSGPLNPDYQQIEVYLKHNLGRSIQELRELCVCPGTTEQGALEARNFKVERWRLPDGSVALFAQSPYKAGLPTLLFYNHYTGPLGKKSSATKRHGYLLGQGGVAGSTFAARLLALDSLIASSGGLPINLKWLIEGAEGTINPHLADLLNEHAAELGAEACLWPSGSYTPDGRAIISLGSKGLLTVELRSHALSREADSTLAGVLPNAAWRIAWALNSIKGDTEEIRISGFGDETDSDLSIPNEDISLLLGSVRDHKVRLSERLKEFGLENYLMELRDPQVLLTEFFTPTANISGFQAGYTGPGSKTALPATASARVDFRLVPNHEPNKVLELLREHLTQKDLGDVEVLPIGFPLKPARTSPTHPFARLVIESVTQTSELSPLVIPLSPEAEPMIFFKEALQDLPVVGLGVGYSASSRGNRVRVDDFLAHAKAIARLLGQMAAQMAPLPLEAFSWEEN
ncbi:MAG: peptidase dimerization domain-containing protein [Chloroflexota bacterium]